MHVLTDDTGSCDGEQRSGPVGYPELDVSEQVDCGARQEGESKRLSGGHGEGVDVDGCALFSSSDIVEGGNGTCATADGAGRGEQGSQSKGKSSVTHGSRYGVVKRVLGRCKQLRYRNWDKERKKEKREREKKRGCFGVPRTSGYCFIGMYGTQEHYQ